MLMAGFLPFSAIYVELYYIFASVWGHKVYIIWSILLIVYIILIIVTAFITGGCWACGSWTPESAVNLMHFHVSQAA